MKLPFLVVHGALVWKVLVVALVALGLTVWTALRTLAAGTQVRADVATRRGSVTPLAPGPVTVHGVIGAGTASTIKQEESQHDDRSEELWIEHEGQRIAIVGPVTVVAGTTTRTSWGIPRGTPPGLAKLATPAAPATLSTVRAGDEVIVGGFVRARGEGDGGYRDSSIAWTMTGSTMWIAATRPQVRARAWGLGAWIGATLVLAGVSYGVLHRIGTAAFKHAESEGAGLSAHLDSFGALAIAAAMPGSRTDALDELTWKSRHGLEHTEENLQVSLAVDELRGGCSVYPLLQLARLEEALAMANGCGTPEQRSDALAFLGRYDEAAAVGVPLGVPVAIAVGRWAEAAEGAERRARQYVAVDKGGADSPLYVQLAIKNQCIAAWYRSLGGAPEGVESVHGHETNATCQVLAALSLPPERQLGALAAIDYGNDYSAQAFGRDVAFALGAPAGERGADSGADMLAFGVRREWLAPFSLASHAESDAATIGMIHGQLAAIAVMRGDLATARHEVELARAAPMFDQLVLAIALHDPDAAVAEPEGYVHPGLENQLALRRGRSLPADHYMGVYPEPCHARLAEAMEAAAAGDGAPLASVFRGCDVYWIAFQRDLIGVLPRVTRHREELAAALRLYRSDLSTYSVDYLPFRLLEDAATYRELAAMVGDTEEAARWKVIYDRHALLLSDRTKTIALMLWSL